MSFHRIMFAAVAALLLFAGCQRIVAPEVKVDPAVAKDLRLRLIAPAVASSGSSEGSTAASSGGGATEWGNLSGTFKVAGATAAPQKLAVTAECSAFPLVSESVVTGPGGALENVVVFVRPKGTAKIPVAPEYAEAGPKQIEIDNRHCRFDPHIVAVRTQQPLVVGNPDPMGHNTKGSPSNNPPFNPVLPAGQKFEYTFTKAESSPVPLQCNIHSWMNGYVVVRDDPYVAISDKDGKFEIKNLPVGDWEFQVWQEKLGGVENVQYQGKNAKWPKGRVTFKIAKGDNPQGDIIIAAEALQ